MKKPLNVLVVEDSENDTMLLIRKIKKGDYDPTFTRVKTADDMLACLNEKSWDIVISDYSMPKFSAPEALKTLQGTGLDLPFIIVSGKVDDEVAVECMTMGAHDFVRKDNMVRLLPAIERELHNLSDRKKYRQANISLEKSELKYRTIIEHSSDMIWSLDTKGNFKFFNKRSEELTGYALNDWIGKSFAPMIHDQDLQKMQNILTKVMSGHTEHYEITVIKKDGSDLILSVDAIPMFESGKVIRYISFGHDITESKQAEEKLQKYAKDLADSNEELKSLDKMKDEFLSNVSHELKTPLISIKGFSEVIHDELYGPLNDKQKKAMNTVIRNSERLDRLINSILYLTLQNSGRDTYTMHPVNITEIIRNIIIDVSPQADSKNLTIENKTQSGLSLIEADMDKLTQVFVNLFENAIKFTPDGGKITVEAFEDGENIHIMVIDNGIGIPTDVISNLFDRFYQVDASTTRRYGGTGIGLYISKLIVELHNGKIWAESEEEIGTTFHVVLPK